MNSLEYYSKSILWINIYKRAFDCSTENYNSFLEMVLFYSYKDLFNEKFELDFFKKDKIKYNLEDRRAIIIFSFAKKEKI